ncbi:MAG TPA: YaiI/YqxD family protein [Terriglobales bacterium]|nr:YaiI/YqxD family protein [Terriglobales bacterium]
MTAIYVDGDACPVKEEVLRVAGRHEIVTHLVSNRWLRGQDSPLVNRVVVGQGFDAADDWIAEHATRGDIVVTADIQLAARCVKSGANVLGPNGKPFTEANIGMALAMRELNAQLRDLGEIRGTNAAFSKQDRSNFLQSLDRLIQELRRRRD